ncbi:MAG TPA: 50S ribosomal protein L15 [Actinomycetota bacterium]|nr:50S ribosomal protein L15 [Actinomycetota bacterium]
MKLHDLHPAPGSTRSKIRVGRGRAGRRGKTAGRGTKGAKARGQIPAAYEGGQMPLHMRIPKLPGFRNPNKVVFNVVNLDTISGLDGATTVDPDALRSKGLVRKKGPVKVLGQGDIDKAVTIKAHAFSQSAVVKIEAAGGTAEVLPLNGK